IGLHVCKSYETQCYGYKEIVFMYSIRISFFFHELPILHCYTIERVTISQFNTTVFGIFRTIREVISIMRRQSKGGTIINIGSANDFFGALYICVWKSLRNP
ncbi:MAG: hypothetical protein ACRD5B_09210, partial [Nitrososphaeraceae archaeon]